VEDGSYSFAPNFLKRKQAIWIEEEKGKRNMIPRLVKERKRM
jgi:hypothetical protein